MKMQRYVVWCPDHGETRQDALVVSATSEDRAASQWAVEYDESKGNFDIANGETFVVYVGLKSAEGCGIYTPYTVSGEITYRVQKGDQR